MLEIKNTEVFGLERAIKASGNPMSVGEINTAMVLEEIDVAFEGGVSRAERLGKAPQGSGHDNFLSGIDVYYDVKYSAYWSMEFQRYHFNQIISSQSKMHKLTSMGKDENFYDMFNKYVDDEVIDVVKQYIGIYNKETNPDKKYFYFMKIISNLPMGFEMWMTVKTNYLQLKTMYFQRRNHKLKEDWGEFCRWAIGLPMFSELIGIRM